LNSALEAAAAAAVGAAARPHHASLRVRPTVHFAR